MRSFMAIINCHVAETAAWPSMDGIAIAEQLVSLRIYTMKTLRNDLPACILHWKEWIFAVTLYPLSLQTPPPQICDIVMKQKNKFI